MMHLKHICVGRLNEKHKFLLYTEWGDVEVVMNIDCMSNKSLKSYSNTVDSEAHIATLLKAGGVCVLPTDTLYGVVANAFDENAVEKVYSIRGRSASKPCIVLISNTHSLSFFSVFPSKAEQQFLSHIWPGPVSVIMDVIGDNFQYLHRGKNSLAFRVPDSAFLQSIIGDSGALIAPSANPEGLNVAETIDEARMYFQNTVDRYHDAGRLFGSPSTLIQLQNGSILLIREGVVSFSSVVSLASVYGIEPKCNK